MIIVLYTQYYLLSYIYLYYDGDDISMIQIISWSCFLR